MEENDEPVVMFNYTKVEAGFKLFTFLNCEKLEFGHPDSITVSLPVTAVEL